jgi:ABC-type branched-subunit amino acid transport system substrate-binding protein
VLPLLRKYSGRNIFMLFPFTGAQALRAPPYDAYVFNLRPSRLQETEELIDRLASSGHSRISVFYQADACGRSGWVGVRTALARRSLSIASEASYRRGATFLNSMARQVNIIQAANPDAVVAVGTCEACAAFIRDARNANLDVPIANLGLAGSEHLLELLLQAGAKTGKDYTQNLINAQAIPCCDNLQLPAVREYRKLIRTRPPKPPPGIDVQEYAPLAYSSVSFEGFLNAKALVAIIRKFGRIPTRSELPAAVESVGSLDLGLGSPVRFGPNHRQGLDKIYFTTVRDRQFAPVAEWKPQAK